MQLKSSIILASLERISYLCTQKPKTSIMPSNLDKDNSTFYIAADYVLNCSKEDADIIFLTGKAGTGKTTFLKYIAKHIKNRVILAPTGIAAINAGGQTIHSFFHFNPNGIYTPDNPNLNPRHIRHHLGLSDERIKTIMNMELLIIDEVSMLRCEMMDAIDCALKVYRRNTKPFGGITTLLIGDVFQLPPVVKNQDNILYNFYESPFFFSSNVYKNAQTVSFELEKVYRQEDLVFLDVLNNIRIGNYNLQDMMVLNSRVGQKANIGTICLYPNNNMASALNQQKFDEIRHQVYVFVGTVINEFNVREMSNVSEIIKLKVGAQVMLMVNSYTPDGYFDYYNGSIGTITSIDPQKSWIKVKLADSGREVHVDKYTWKNVQQVYDEEKEKIVEVEKGSFTQIPVRLAWAVTIHKSQGLTLNSVQVNVNRTFASGQTYVALSRCRSLSGLFLEQPIGLGTVIVDQRVVNYYNSIKNEMRHALDEVDAVTKLYEVSKYEFEKGNAIAAISSFCRARKRNNYMTHLIHNRYLRLANIAVSKFWIYRKASELVSDIRENNLHLQKELDQLEDEHEELERNNTELLSYNESMQRHIRTLENTNTILKLNNNEKENEITKLKDSLHDIKQRFIDKTIELDNLKSLPWYKRLFW